MSNAQQQIVADEEVVVENKGEVIIDKNKFLRILEEVIEKEKKEEDEKNDWTDNQNKLMEELVIMHLDGGLKVKSVKLIQQKRLIFGDKPLKKVMARFKSIKDQEVENRIREKIMATMGEI